MRTIPAARCGSFVDGQVPENRTGIIRYNPTSTLLPETLPQPQNRTCDDVHTEWLNPIVPWCVDLHPQNNVTKDTYEVEIQANPDASLGPPGIPYRHWMLGERPLWLNFSMPTILNVDASLGNPNYTVVEGQPLGGCRCDVCGRNADRKIVEDYNIGFIYLILDARQLPVLVLISLNTASFPLHG
jgi:hypothetical protein